MKKYTYRFALLALLCLALAAPVFGADSDFQIKMAF